MKFNKIIVLLFILVISLVGYYLLSFNNTSKVKATLSKDAAEHPLGDYVIEASRKNHSIRWHISLPDNPTDKIYIDVRVEGEKKKPFIETEDIHRAILKKLFDKWHRSYNFPPPEGESVKQVEKRVNSFIKDLIKKMKKERINVAISAHGNSMRPFRRYFEKLTMKQMMKLENPWDDYFEYHVKT